MFIIDGTTRIINKTDWVIATVVTVAGQSHFFFIKMKKCLLSAPEGGGVYGMNG